MANKDHLALLKQGVEVWNRWRNEHENIVPDLSGADLGNANLHGADFRRADLSGANLSKTDLGEVNLRRAYLRGADLRGADLSKTDPSKTTIWGANLSEADLSEANLSEADLNEADLNKANLSKANLKKVNLSGADLSKVDLTGSNLTGSNLTGSNLRMANLRMANLSEAILSGTDLMGTYFSEADLSTAILRGVDLTKADLSGVKLVETDLSGADLSKVDLSGKDLTGANLTGADLSYTVLVQTNFNKANLTGCRIYGIAAWDVKLDGANQSDFVITRRDEPDITVDNLEVAQFIYLLLRNEKIRHVIDTITSKVVLILGRFTKDRKIVLDALKDELRLRDYIPILFNFERSTNRDLTETVSTLAHMARFVIADITDPRSIPQELMAIVRDLPSVPVQPILQPSVDDEYGMFEHFKRYPWVLPIYHYKDVTEAVAEIKTKIIDPAESKAHELIPDKTREKANGT